MLPVPARNPAGEAPPNGYQIASNHCEIERRVALEGLGREGLGSRV